MHTTIKTMKQFFVIIFLLLFLSCKCQTGYLGVEQEQPEIGTIFSTNLASSASTIRTGSSGTWVFDGDGLTISGTGTDAADNFLGYNWFTDIENNESVIEFIPNTDGYGIGLGYAGTNNRSYYGRVVLYGSEKGKLIFDGVNEGVVTNRANSGTSYFDVVNGELHRLTLKRTPDTIFFKISNMVSLDSQILKYPLNYSTALQFDSYKTGRISIFWHGGGQTVKNFYYKSDIKKNPKLLITGDSNTQGAFAGTASGRYGSLLAASTSDRVIICAGAGNASGDIVNLLPEILLIKPVAVLVNIGTNGVTSGHLDQIISTLSGAGIKVYLSTIFPTGVGVNVPGNAIVRSKTSVPIIDFDSTLLNGGSVLYPAYNHDGIHLTAAGNEAVYNQLLTEFNNLLKP